MREIALANSKDKFKIARFDAGADMVRYHEINLGRHYVYDVKSGQKLFRYADLQPDKFGDPCSIWYKKVALPKQLKDVAPMLACCFMFSLSGTTTYICSDEGFHCLYPARVLIHTFKEGCLAGEKGLALDGTDKFVPVPEEKNPNSEVYGEDLSITRDTSFDPGNPSFFQHNGEDALS